MKDNDIKISLDISKDLKEKLDKLSKEREMSISGLIRYIIKNYLNKEYESQ